jgi:hypothetical protein
VVPQITRQPTLLVTSFFVVVPLATLVLAYASGPPPLLAASGVFAIHAVNASVMAFSAVPGFMLSSHSDVALLLGAFALNALLAAILARWRRRGGAGSNVAPAGVRDASSSVTSDLAEQLAKLAKLRDDGKLTEDEYSSAKQKLLK